MVMVMGKVSINLISFEQFHMHLPGWGEGGDEAQGSNNDFSDIKYQTDSVTLISCTSTLTGLKYDIQFLQW